MLAAAVNSEEVHIDFSPLDLQNGSAALGSLRSSKPATHVLLQDNSCALLARNAPAAHAAPASLNTHCRCCQASHARAHHVTSPVCVNDCDSLPLTLQPAQTSLQTRSALIRSSQQVAG